jgi:predicted NBD/HSP70 family sugar kinase
MSRTQLAAATGLSPASITAIGSELIAQGMLTDAAGGPAPAVGLRGRPAVQVGFARNAAHCVIVELDVNLARFSLVNYAGGLIDRTETPVAPALFADRAPGAVLAERIAQLMARNPAESTSLRRIAISAQGILERDGEGLKWSPIAATAGHNLIAPLERAFDVPVTLDKRGRLLAEGARVIYPELGELPIAAVFIGSTVAMGLSLPSRAGAQDGATEFGHMNHLPDGALCRCGMRGCVEAYAADYGVLRTAYGVPDRVPPAATVPPAAYQQLVSLARTGHRNVLHAFNVAGRALGYGLGRVLAIASPAHIVITGPGGAAFDLMRPEIDAALRNCLVGRVNGPPAITVHHDEREPIFLGMLGSTLAALDDMFADRLASEPRASNAR